MSETSSSLELIIFGMKKDRQKKEKLDNQKTLRGQTDRTTSVTRKKFETFIYLAYSRGV